MQVRMCELLLYTTSGCHLCEHAAEMLAALSVRHPLKVAPVDISESKDLVARYGMTIPVVRNPRTGTELNWPFEPDQVLSLLHPAAPD